MVESEITEQSTNLSTNSIINQKKTNCFDKPIQISDNISRTIEIISDLLSDICEEGNINYDIQNSKIKPFLSQKIPPISIKNYLERLAKYSKMSESSIILILVYIDRICNINSFKLTNYNIHKLILASMITSIKYNEDEYYSLSFYAKLGGVTNSQLQMLEYEFLSLINFELFVDETLFNKYNDYIINFEEDDGEDDEDEEEGQNPGGGDEE